GIADLHAGGIDRVDRTAFQAVAEQQPVVDAEKVPKYLAALRAGQRAPSLRGGDPADLAVRVRGHAAGGKAAVLPEDGRRDPSVRLHDFRAADVRHGGIDRVFREHGVVFDGGELFGSTRGGPRLEQDLPAF